MEGKLGEGWSPVVKGNYIKIVFKSDATVQKQGFEITKIGYR
jgi:hypothetical protein